MKRLLALLMTLPLFCTACAALPAEERAFAVALLVEKEGEVWRVYGRIPTYQTGGGYLSVSGEGETLPDALRDMEAASPMQLHLSQLRLLVLDVALAEDEELPEVLQHLAERADLRPQCAVAMTDAPLEAVAEALKPAAGERLSKAIDVLLDTRKAQGGILPADFADVLRMGERQSPVLIGLTVEEGNISLFGGYALTTKGRLAARLDAREVQLLSLLTGSTKELRLSVDNSAAAVREISAQVHLLPDWRGAQADVRMQLISSAHTAEELAQVLADACADLLTRLSQQGCDVLGLGRRAICHAEDMAQWYAMDWPTRLRQLRWNVSVRVDDPA